MQITRNLLFPYGDENNMHHLTVLENAIFSYLSTQAIHKILMDSDKHIELGITIDEDNPFSYKLLQSAKFEKKHYPCVHKISIKGLSESCRYHQDSIRTALENLVSYKMVSIKDNTVLCDPELFKMGYIELDLGSGLKGHQLLVYSYLKYLSRENNGKCYIKRPHIANKLGLTLDTVKKCKSQLISKGWITTNNDGTFKVNNEPDIKDEEQKSVSAPAPQEQLTDNKLQELFDDYGQNKKVETGHKPVSYNNEQTRVEIESLNDWGMCRASSPEEVIMLKSMPVIIQHTPFS